MYVADALLFQQDVPVLVDVFDRLPTPFGLLRYGVAPDHLKMKSLARALQRTLDDERVRFFGNVTIGSDVTVEELRAGYSAVVYTFGAASDRRLGLVGEDLPGSRSATEFVMWYSGHPDVPADRFDLSAVSSVVVVGVGNVAVDVARVLAKQVDALRSTDIPDAVLEVLAHSAVTDVHVLGRRGPVHAKFTSKELAELGELAGVDVVVDPVSLELTDEEEAVLAVEPALARNLRVLREWAQRERSDAPRRLHLHFWTRPVALVGGDADGGALSAVRVESTELDEEGQCVPVGSATELPAQLLLRSVGYRGRPVEGVPFDERSGTIPHTGGRVHRDGAVSPGEFVAGWIGRGPVGVLGTNRADAEAVVAQVLEDAPGLLARPLTGPDPVALLRERGVVLVDTAAWGAIDAAEVALGREQAKARTKIATWSGLLEAAGVTR
jgi:ferredoxin--NADP+ reductase